MTVIWVAIVGGLLHWLGAPASEASLLASSARAGEVGRTSVAPMTRRLVRGLKIFARRPPPEDDDQRDEMVLSSVDRLDQELKKKGVNLRKEALEQMFKMPSSSSSSTMIDLEAKGHEEPLFAHEDEEWARRESEIRPGNVILTQPDGHFDHFLTEAVVLILEDDPERGTVGLIIDRNTPWEVGEMAPVFEKTKLEKIPLCMGGGDGPDKILMLHTISNLEGAVPLADSGILVGGVAAAVQLTDQEDVDPRQFHFFFKRCEWLPGLLQKEVDADIWEIAKASPSLLLKHKDQRKKRLWNDIRSRLKKTIQPMKLE
eukprot:CAMPEP_0114509508 /NCGR_PEP_ID=MMETSP0109-20121206/13252_1 /TAXON_ID=29199 /ORGANISM="Chlorarachnion reptans, Strain CCCM449" /LENGTH=314 /DNA_ID=CAMNT_0001688675 /DNA_START=44 /DNA_END=988 /DNA_ORIENTATION=+